MKVATKPEPVATTDDRAGAARMMLSAHPGQVLRTASSVSIRRLSDFSAGVAEICGQ
jgi:hypothetical protein